MTNDDIFKGPKRNVVKPKYSLRDKILTKAIFLAS
jgi:hypothetical protein